MIDKYPNPPVQEAVCEFRFSSGAEWDITFPGVFYKEIDDEFPEYRSVRQLSPTRKQNDEQILELAERVQFMKEDNSALLQIAPNIFSVIHFAPYPGWDAFKASILSNAQRHHTVRPQATLDRIGLRYINHIEIPTNEAGLVELSEYFYFYPEVTGDLPDFGNARMGVIFQFEDGNDIMQVQLNQASAAGSQSLAYKLDLDYFRSNTNDVSIPEPGEWLETAHDHIIQIFESCITDRTRELFKE